MWLPSEDALKAAATIISILAAICGTAWKGAQFAWKRALKQAQAELVRDLGALEATVKASHLHLTSHTADDMAEFLKIHQGHEKILARLDEMKEMMGEAKIEREVMKTHIEWIRQEKLEERGAREARREPR